MESVIIDTNIFFNIWILDPILTLADEELFEPLWSDMIMAEAKRNLPKVWKNATSNQIDAFINTLNAAFPWAQISNWKEHMQGLELPDPDDCHVFAAAIAGKASTIVTLNLIDFPVKELTEYGIKVEHPDTFLTRLYEESPVIVDHAMKSMISRKKHPPRTITEEYDGLRKAGLKTFTIKLEKHQC